MSAYYDHGRRRRRLWASLWCFIILILIIVFLVWLILRPTKPQFILQDATVYNFNLTGGDAAAAATGLNLLTTTIQVSLASRNPNKRIGIYYDRVDVYATYRGQQITPATLLPASYQGHKEVTVWSPFVNGNAVPVAPYLGVEIGQDQNAGRVLINIRVDGRIRWKVGTFISGRYRLNANCPAYLSFGGGQYSQNSILVGSTAKYQLVQQCYVDV
ncbi:PREDICTED: NDR1/HIN1-like protein 12 [Ipomoea nil]|uniref:NDR1/HIN1-like protein 12 n=1 Tax=Ipomoea nil TaxID=35883 RepID=UPI000900A5CC|nr:PREDICTED: NDR1/HIN1-like protein 12 [Ipomoea nil]